MLKVCKKCGQEKELSLFVANPKCADGHTHECKACRFEYQKARQLRLNPLESRPREIARRLLEQGLKKCSKCNETKALSEYYNSSRWHGYAPKCKACFKASWATWKDKNRDHLSEYNREYKKRESTVVKVKTARRMRIEASPRSVMQITLRHGLRRRFTENPAMIEDLMAMWTAQEGRCAVTGITMTWGKGEVLPTSISLDRIDPDGGYSADNLRLICHCVNAFKGRMSDDEMFSMALAIVTNMKKPRLRLVS